LTRAGVRARDNAVAAHRFDLWDAYSGREWKLQYNAFRDDSDHICTFHQKDRELNGTCSAGKGGVAIVGTVDGEKVT